VTGLKKAKRRYTRYMGIKGKVGCGCLIGILVIIMVLAGLSLHPVSLRFLGKSFRYEDKIVPADAIFVPRFQEDHNGELYVEAFREYFSGNGKVVYIENDKVLGTDIYDLVSRLAKSRGIKDNVTKPLYAEDREDRKTSFFKQKLKEAGLKKVIVVVPEYASRRYHNMYDPTRDGGAVLYMIKPAKVSYFRADRWWRDELSRSLMAREFYASLLYYYSMLRKEKTG
jgi:hypothetical protein